MERMNPKKLNAADIKNIIRLEENEINGPTYQDYKTVKLGSPRAIWKIFKKFQGAWRP